VQIALFDVATRTETVDAIGELRNRAGMPTGDNWWWN